MAQQSWVQSQKRNTVKPVGCCAQCRTSKEKVLYTKKKFDQQSQITLVIFRRQRVKDNEIIQFCNFIFAQVAEKYSCGG
jgi:hypothetical protein